MKKKEGGPGPTIYSMKSHTFNVQLCNARGGGEKKTAPLLRNRCDKHLVRGGKCALVRKIATLPKLGWVGESARWALREKSHDHL